MSKWQPFLVYVGIGILFSELGKGLPPWKYIFLLVVSLYVCDSISKVALDAVRKVIREERHVQKGETHASST
jgi:hypothetical protein